MRWFESQRRTQLLVQLFQRLPGQGIHQVDVEGFESLRGFGDRRTGLCSVMHAAQRLQLGIIKALHADR